MNHYLPQICKTLLLITHENFVILLITSGYLLYKKDIFARALLILLFTMIFNTYLKSIWQVPFALHIGKEGWAYPSGHMQTTFVFWCWLAYELKQKWMYFVTLVLLIGVGYSLIYLGYHNMQDIQGAIIFGVLTLFGYFVLCRIIPNRLIGFLLSIVGLLIISFIPKTFNHVWLAEGALVGFSIGWFFNNEERNGVVYKIFSFIGAILGVVLIYFIAPYLKNKMDIRVFVFTQFFLIALWVSCCIQKFLNKVIK